MDRNSIRKTQWVLKEIGSECEKEMPHKSDDDILFKLRSSITDLSDCVKNGSMIEARTEYYTALLRLSQVGSRFDMHGKDEGKSCNLDSILEELKDVSEHLYAISDELDSQKDKFAMKETVSAIDKLDSVILELEVTNE